MQATPMRPLPRLRRALYALAALTLTLLAAALAIAWLLLAGSRPRLDGTLALHGLAAPVTVTRDRDGVVSLTARNRSDLAFALGFVHGQERFFPMDLMRRDAAGELAALVGPAALARDENHRRHRFRALAERLYAHLAPGDRALLDAYARGVNAGLNALDVRPWEYLLLRARPRPWQPADTILAIDAMYFDLSADGSDPRALQITQLRAALPRPLADFLLQPDGRWEAALDGSVSAAVPIPDAAVYDLRRIPAAAALAQVSLPAPLPGSNTMAVAGRLTASGAAIVADDMHLTLRVPNIWFRARMRYPDPDHPGRWIDLNGVTLPGTPALVAGSNGHIAWGFTNSYGNWMDWVRVIRDPADPTRYRVPGGWARIETHREIIAVKGGTPVPLNVEDTRWGPIMGKDLDGTPLALDWTAQHLRGVNLGILGLERTDSVAAALAIAPGFGMPPQNIVVGDRAGHIGWTLTGNAIPIRKGIDPDLPGDWSQPGTGWTGWLPAAQFPRIIDPPSGRLWTANNRTLGGAALALVGDGGYDLGARARQLRDDLMARQRFAPDDLLAIQLDDRARFLTPWYGLLRNTLAGHRDPRLAELERLTAVWSDRAAVGSVDYRLVRAFRAAVYRNALAPFVAVVKARYPDFAWPKGSDAEAAVWALVTRQPMHLLAPRYPNWQALLTESALQVANVYAAKPGGLAAQTWGRRNTAAIDQPLARALPGWLGRFLDMPRVQLPGDNNMPRVQAPSFGASERFGIMPGHEAASYLHMPGGQSDNPLSPYYGAGFDAWVRGEPTPLLPGPARYRLTLRPVAHHAR